MNGIAMSLTQLQSFRLETPALGHKLLYTTLKKLSQPNFIKEKANIVYQ